MGQAITVERELLRPGCELHYRYRDSASGRWFVFLHGAGMDGHMFDQQLAALPADVGFVCWDARGHGQSRLSGKFAFADMLEDLHALLSPLSARDLTLVGQFMGGNLAQSYVDAHPDVVTRLALIDCTVNHGPLTSLERRALQLTGPILSLYPWSVAVRQSARACGVTPATIAYADRCLRCLGKRRFVEVMGFWRDALDPAPGYRFPLPTLALLGEEDASGNIAKALRQVAGNDPNVELVVLPEAGHNSNMDQPQLANDALARFARTALA